MDDEVTQADEQAHKIYSMRKMSTDMNERLSLRIDAQKAARYRHKKKNRYAANGPAKPLPQDLKNGLRQIRNKIKDPFDDEDEDENGYIISPIFQTQDESPAPESQNLFDALTPDEKRMLRQQETDQTIRMQQNAGKMEALLLADKLARETAEHGIRKKDLNDGMLEAAFDPERQQEKLIKKEVGGKLGLKGKIEDGKIIQAARGIKKTQQLGGTQATKNLDMKDMVLIGEGKVSDLQLAKLILKKSGQDISKLESHKKETSKPVKLKHFNPKSKPTKSAPSQEQ